MLCLRFCCQYVSQQHVMNQMTFTSPVSQSPGNLVKTQLCHSLFCDFWHWDQDVFWWLVQSVISSWVDRLTSVVVNWTQPGNYQAWRCSYCLWFLGNQERGWNDPPQFSYGLQMSRTPQRTLLNKRAAPPVSGERHVPSGPHLVYTWSDCVHVCPPGLTETSWLFLWCRSSTPCVCAIQPSGPAPVRCSHTPCSSR